MVVIVAVSPQPIKSRGEEERRGADGAVMQQRKHTQAHTPSIPPSLPLSVYLPLSLSITITHSHTLTRTCTQE